MGSCLNIRHERYVFLILDTNSFRNIFNPIYILLKREHTLLFSYSHFVIAYRLEDFYLAPGGFVALYWFKGYVSSLFFFNWKDSFDFIYLVVTYMSIFKTCAVCWLAPRARQITNREWKY